jgi:lipid-A-disaccharide synthase
LRAKEPNLRFAGVGGDSMKSIDFESLFDISEISVMGLFDVLPKLRNILRRIKQVVDDIEASRPCVIVTVDRWGFAHQVLSRLKKRGSDVPKIHYVAPQVWAWKKGRAKTVAQLVDHLMTLLPFEPPYFQKHGLECTFVGHPVIERFANQDTSDFKSRHNIPTDSTLIVALPGSRNSEVRRLIPVFKKVLLKVKEAFPNLFIVIPTVESVREKVTSEFSDLNIPYKVILGHEERYCAFKDSLFALAASGTVSLELTVCKTPHVITYKFGAFVNQVLMYFSNTKYANLINILAQKFIIPEFILKNCKPSLITPVVIDILIHTEKAAHQIEQSQQYLKMLQPDTNISPSEKAAQVVLDIISKQYKKEN